MQTVNGQKSWLVGGRTYLDFAEAVEAQNRRLKDFFRRAGISEEELEALPKRVIPEGATPENYDPESEWPISAELDKLFGQKFRLVSAAQLNSSQPETRYLIPGVLAAGQLGGIFGAFKTLKTSLAADLLISLASGTPFLGRFPVSQPGRVLFLSGESGLPALKSIARRICSERGMSLDTLENFVCSPDVPKLGDPFDMMAFTELVEREKPVCVVIDPAFLALGGGRGPSQKVEESVRDRRIAASAGRTVRVDRLRGARRASLQGRQSGRAGHARGPGRQRLCGILGPVAVGLASTALRAWDGTSRIVAHDRQPGRRPGSVGTGCRGRGGWGRADRRAPSLRRSGGGEDADLSHPNSRLENHPSLGLVARDSERRAQGRGQRGPQPASPGDRVRASVPADAGALVRLPGRTHGPLYPRQSRHER